MIEDRERWRKVGEIQEDRGQEPSEVEEDVTAPGLLQRSAADSDSEKNSNLEPENDEMLVSEGEELEGLMNQRMLWSSQGVNQCHFPLDYYNRELAGKPKGIKRVLGERGCGQNEVYCWTIQPHNRPGCAPGDGSPSS